MPGTSSKSIWKKITEWVAAGVLGVIVTSVAFIYNYGKDNGTSDAQDKAWKAANELDHKQLHDADNEAKSALKSFGDTQNLMLQDIREIKSKQVASENSITDIKNSIHEMRVDIREMLIQKNAVSVDRGNVPHINESLTYDKSHSIQ